jgi:hypothetical protein
MTEAAAKAGMMSIAPPPLQRKHPSQGSAPGAFPKPPQMIIARTGLFYCATFPRRPGFPRSRTTCSLLRSILS